MKKLFQDSQTLYTIEKLRLSNNIKMSQIQQNLNEFAVSLPSNYLNKQGGLSSIPVSKILDYERNLLSRKQILPCIVEFKKAIEESHNLRMYFNDKVLKSLPLHEHKSGSFRLLGDSVDQAMDRLNKAITTAPTFENKEITGVPIYCLFLDYMHSKQGQAFFSDRLVNQKLKNVFNAYGSFLDQPESLENFSSWISLQALKHWNPDEWIVDLKDKNYGFKCWHDFFLRRFKQEKRPIAEGSDIIANVCESNPLDSPRMPVRNVRKTDNFWLKDVRYSLTDMIGPKFNHVIDDFVGGTVYQAYLTPWNYHKWHSPVDGQILQIQSLPGTYFQPNPNIEDGNKSYINSQPFLTCAAVRQVFLIQTKDFGKMIVILVGMVEVSSCVVNNPELPLPRKVKKGEQIGCFKFGGSSHVVIFDNSVDVEMIAPMPDPENPENRDFKVNVRSALAQVKSRPKK